MGLPTSLLQDMSSVSANDWAEQAGLNWEAVKVPLEYCHSDGVMRDSSMNAIVRSDTGQELGVVSPKYQIVQPSTILSSFEQSCARLGDCFKMDGIGVYDNGKIIWGRAKSDVPIRIHGQDHLDSYLYMITSFDGSTSTMGFVSTLRTVCSNALHLAQKRGDKLFNVSHRSEYRENTNNALDAYMRKVDEFTQQANSMAVKRINPEQVVSFMAKLLYPSKSDFTDREKTTINKYVTSAALGAGSNLASVNADETGMSIWGTVNGVTNIIDNEPIRKSANDKSMFIGAGNVLKTKAWEQALKMAA